MVHVVDLLEEFIGDILDEDPLEGELAFPFVGLPPIREILILDAGDHFGDSDELSAFDDA